MPTTTMFSMCVIIIADLRNSGAPNWRKVTSLWRTSVVNSKLHHYHMSDAYCKMYKDRT